MPMKEESEGKPKKERDKEQAIRVKFPFENFIFTLTSLSNNACTHPLRLKMCSMFDAFANFKVKPEKHLERQLEFHSFLFGSSQSLFAALNFGTFASILSYIFCLQSAFFAYRHFNV